MSDKLCNNAHRLGFNLPLSTDTVIVQSLLIDHRIDAHPASQSRILWRCTYFFFTDYLNYPEYSALKKIKYYKSNDIAFIFLKTRKC
jgi:hypothetical protein